MPPPSPPSPQVVERQRRHRRGHTSEWIAAALLICKGYRILARRWASAAGEIDLVAAKGARLVFVEVKLRRSLDDAEAAIAGRQRQRIRRAADLWLARHPRYRDYDIGFDLVCVAPRRWPRHIVNGL